MLGMLLLLTCGTVGKLMRWMFNFARKTLGHRPILKAKWRRRVLPKNKRAKKKVIPGHDCQEWSDIVPTQYLCPSRTYNLLVHLEEGRLYYSQVCYMTMSLGYAKQRAVQALLELCGEETISKVTGIYDWSENQGAFVLFPEERAEDVIALLSWLDPAIEACDGGLPLISSHGLCFSQIPALARMAHRYCIPRLRSLWPRILQEHLANYFCLDQALSGIEVIDALHCTFQTRYFEFNAHFKAAINCAFSYGFTLSQMQHLRISQNMEILILKNMENLILKVVMLYSVIDATSPHCPEYGANELGRFEEMQVRLAATLRTLLPSQDPKLHCQWTCRSNNGVCAYHKTSNYLERFINDYGEDAEFANYAPLYQN